MRGCIFCTYIFVWTIIKQLSKINIDYVQIKKTKQQYAIGQKPWFIPIRSIL
jgi:hypothetical protein